MALMSIAANRKTNYPDFIVVRYTHAPAKKSNTNIITIRSQGGIKATDVLDVCKRGGNLCLWFRFKNVSSKCQCRSTAKSDHTITTFLGHKFESNAKKMQLEVLLQIHITYTYIWCGQKRGDKVN